MHKNTQNTKVQQNRSINNPKVQILPVEQDWHDQLARNYFCVYCTQKNTRHTKFQRNCVKNNPGVEVLPVRLEVALSIVL